MVKVGGEGRVCVCEWVGGWWEGGATLFLT